MLKAMGIEEEKIDQIIEAHAETVDSLKEERNNYKADAEKLADVQKDLDRAKEQLAKKGEGETVAKDEYDKLQKEYADYKNDVQAKQTKTAKETAYRELLKSVGVGEKRIASILKVTDIEAIELDKDGKIKDADKHIETVKTEWADFIETQSQQGVKTSNPPANNGKGTGKTKEEIMAIRDPATRQAEIAKNPEAFGLKFD